jgi:ribonuclease HI
MKHLEADLYFDAGSRGNPGPAGVGVRIINSIKQETIAETSIFLGHTTNNAAEYMGLIHGLQLAQQHGVTRINIYSDSMLVVKHIKGEYKVRNSRLKPIYDRAIDLLKLFGDGYEINHIPRAKNARADELANEAMNRGY